jgi:hypothetical protein
MKKWKSLTIFDLNFYLFRKNNKNSLVAFDLKFFPFNENQIV